MIYECYKCDAEFEGDLGKNVTCPKCETKYTWDEFSDGEDYTYTYVPIVDEN
jgi:hypothetical protein